MRDGDAVEIRLLRAFEDETAVNSAATGAPTISGTAQVSEILTANTSGIADADGLDNAAFSYQWLADNTEVAGATGSTYTLVEADEGKAIKVQVSFTDDAGHDETLTSVATEEVAAAPPENTEATGVPRISGTAQVGETLTARHLGHRRRGWAGQRRLHLPVAGRRRRHSSRYGLDLHAGRRRRGQGHQSAGELHRRRRQ